MFAEAITLRGCFRRLLSLRPCRDGGCGLTLETLEMDAIFSNRQLSYEHDKATLGILCILGSYSKEQVSEHPADSDTQGKARLGHAFVYFCMLSYAFIGS